MISEVFRKFIDNHESGLGIVELPTSIGKTFSTFECIAKYTQEWAEYKQTHKRNGEFRQIIVVTPLKKNLQANNKGANELDGLERAYDMADSQDEEPPTVTNYVVGQYDGLNQSIATAPVVRQLYRKDGKQCHAGDENFIISLLQVGSVKMKNYTVLPFPAKYLREIAALQLPKKR